MRVALKIAYDGRSFRGFARQPDVRTVEGEVLYALEKVGVIVDAQASRLRGASRTDAGVSALGNVVAFDTDAPEDAIVGQFNDAAKDVWAWAVATLAPGFDPRRAKARWYRYHLTGEHDVETLRSVAPIFLGSHNFAAFATPDTAQPRRRVDDVTVEASIDGVLVDVRAPSFLRGMVRRIVAALLAVERGDATPETLRDTLLAGRGPDLGAVSAEPLVLMDVDLGFPFRATVDRACRGRVKERSLEAIVAARFWREAAARIAVHSS